MLVTLKHYVHILPDDILIAMLATEEAYERLVAKALASMASKAEEEDAQLAA